MRKLKCACCGVAKRLTRGDLCFGCGQLVCVPCIWKGTHLSNGMHLLGGSMKIVKGRGRATRYDMVAAKTIMHLLDGASKKHGLQTTKYAATKWASMQASRARMLKDKAALEKELAAIQAKLA